MSSFDCTKSCKKTKQTRDSSYCTGTYQIVDGKVVYGCDTGISALEQSDKNFLTCNFYDLNILDNCNSCPLYCKENKNPNIKRAEEAMKNVSNILSSLGPLASIAGVDQSELKKATEKMRSSEINTNTPTEIEDTIKLTNYAKNILSSVMSGRSVDIVEFKKIKEEIERKYKK